MDESGKYIIAFRGTNDKKDIKADIQIGKNNINPQHKDAKEFTQKILNQITKDKNIPFYEAKKYLTLVGHSLGGIHTQQIATVNKIKGFAFNPYGANRLISMPKNPCFPSIGISTCDMSYALFGKFAPISKKIDEKWVNENIYTISYHDNGKINGDILSNFFTNATSKHIGKVIPIIGKNVDFMQGHEIENLIKTLDEYAKISDNCDINFMQITKNRVNKDKFDKEILIKYADKKQTLPIYQNFCISKKQDFNSQEIISIENLDNDSGYKM